MQLVAEQPERMEFMKRAMQQRRSERGQRVGDENAADDPSRDASIK